MKATTARTGRVWIGAATIAAASTVLVAHPVDAQQEADVCALFGAVDDTRGVASAELRELSGMVASTAHDGVLWAHNDSGGGRRLYAVALDGADLGIYDVKGARNRDWEDIAAGTTAEGRAVLYVGNIGDNSASRESAFIDIVAEPEAAPDGNGGALEALGTVTVTYPDGPTDAEALVVDPVTGDAVIVTTSTEGVSRIMTISGSDLSPGSDVVAVDGGDLAVPDEVLAAGTLAVTAADVSPDGSIVLVRTTTHVLAYARAEGQSVAEALTGTPCLAPAIDEPNPQAIAFSGDGTSYLLAGEVAGAITNGDLPPGSATKLTSVDVLDEPAPPTTEVPTTETPTTEAPVDTQAPVATEAPADTQPPVGTEAPADTAPAVTAAPDDDSTASADADEESGGGLPIVLIAVGALVVLALVVVLVVVRKQRRRPLPGSAPLTDTPPFDPGTSPAAAPSGGFAAPPAAPPAGAPLPPPVAPAGGDDTPPSGQPLPPPSV